MRKRHNGDYHSPFLRNDGAGSRLSQRCPGAGTSPVLCGHAGTNGYTNGRLLVSQGDLPPSNLPQDQPQLTTPGKVSFLPSLNTFSRYHCDTASIRIKELQPNKQVKQFHSQPFSTEPRVIGPILLPPYSSLSSFFFKALPSRQNYLNACSYLEGDY